MNLSHSLSWKLSALLILVTLAFFVFNAVIFHTFVRERMEQRDLNRLEQQVELATTTLDLTPEKSPEELFGRRRTEQEKPENEDLPGPRRLPPPVLVTDLQGNILVGPLREQDLIPSGLAKNFPEVGSRWSGLVHGQVKLAGARIRRDGKDLLVLDLALPDGPGRRGPGGKVRPPDGWDGFRLSVFLLRGVVGLLAAIVAGLLGVRLITGRLSRLQEGFVRLEKGDMSVHIEPGGDDELGQLIQSFNGLVSSLGRAQGELLSQDKARREMLADVSHELGTPLTSLLCQLELLQERANEVGPDWSERIRVAVEEGRSLGERIQDLLTLAREDVEAFPLELGSVNLQRLLQGLVEKTRALCGEGGVQVKTSFLPDIHQVTGDASRLEQVFRNLLENARRALFQGGTIEIRVIPPGQGMLAVEVRDDGPGIPPEDLDTLFERFQRGAGTREGGTGLGLAIVKRIVERHGGRCEVESQPGEGSCFRVLLPCEDLGEGLD